MLGISVRDRGHTLDRVVTTAGVLERVDRLCATELSAKALREAVLGLLRPVIPFDAHVWLLTDPVTRVGTSPLADVPMLPWPLLPRLLRLRYLTRVNRWADLMDARRHVALLSVETGGAPERSLLWRECLRGLGVSDVASTAFWDRYGCWGWLDLWRARGAATFDVDDQALLAEVARRTTPALRGAQARTFVADADPMSLSGPAVVILGPELQVRSQTAWAAEALFRLNPPDEPMPTIPAAVYNIGAALVADESGVPVGAPRSRVHLGAGRWVTLRADRMTREGAEEGDVVVTIEPSTFEERRELFGLAHGLSPREREVFTELTRGLDSHSIAHNLVLSDHTVNDHVKAVLAKCGTATRQALLSRIAGTG